VCDLCQIDKVSFRKQMSNQITALTLLPKNRCITENIIAQKLSLDNSYTRGFPAHLEAYRIKHSVTVHMTLFAFNKTIKIVVPGENQFRYLESVFDIDNFANGATDIAMFWVLKKGSVVNILGSYYVKGDEAAGYECVGEAKRK